jgi:hypothetical protein
MGLAGSMARPTGPGSEFYRKSRNYYLESRASAIGLLFQMPPLKWPVRADTVGRAFGQALKNPERIQ